MATIYLTIDGEQYPMLVGSLSASLQTGLAGTTLSAQVCSIGASPPNPNTNLPVELTIGSLTFNCRLASVGHESRSGASVVVYSLQANGPQERLRRNVAYSSRITTAVSSILDDLLLGSGLTGSVPDDKNLTDGFDFSGTLGDAIAKLAGRAGMGIYIGPSGVVNLRDLTNLDAAPFAWTVGSKNPFSNFTKSRSKDLPITRVHVKGAVEKDDPADPDSDTRTLRFTMNGVDPWVDIPRDVVYDEITDVRLNSTSQTITFRGSGSEAAADVVHYQKGRRLLFNTLPADTDVVEVDVTIQYAYGMAEDTAVQAELSAIPPSGWDGIVEHTITDESIRTSGQAQQLADEQIVVLSQPKKSMAATVHSASIFEPLELVTGTHSVDGWSEQLPVVSTQLSWDNAKGELRQEVSCENGAAPTSGSASSIRGLFRLAIQPNVTAPLPTQSSTAGSPDFTLSVTPASESVTAGTGSGVEFIVTASPVAGFSNDIELSASGLAGCTFVFDTTTLNAGNSWTTTLTVTPTDGTWTDSEAGEEGTFQVRGTAGPMNHSANGEVVIDPEPECTGDYTIIISNDNPTCPSCQTHYIQFKAISENPACVGQTVSIQIQDLVGIGPDHPCYPFTSDWWTVNVSEFNLTIAADAGSATPVEIEFYPNGQEEEGCGPNNRQWCGPSPFCDSQTTYAAFTAIGPDGVPQLGCFMVSDQGGC